MPLIMRSNVLTDSGQSTGNIMTTTRFWAALISGLKTPLGARRLKKRQTTSNKRSPRAAPIAAKMDGVVSSGHLLQRTVLVQRE